MKFKKSEDYGYFILDRNGGIVGTVRKDRIYGLWCAFKWEPEHAKKDPFGTLTYVKGGKTRNAATAALVRLMEGAR